MSEKNVVDIVQGGSEDGSACIVIELQGGKITVEHGDTGDTLMISSVDHGFWDTLWAYLETSGRVSYRNQSL